MNKASTPFYQYYGTASKAGELIDFLSHVTTTNLAKEQTGKKKTPVCIWGKHGIGKTEIVETFAKDQGYDFAYIAPAQFEEMGDLIGMPAIEEGRTVFRPPAWVPREEGPGILLIDDVNRADDRILRGIMQLLQNYELVSWKLPSKWQIVLTANPDGGDYSVTPMDDAMLTRMLHITLSFDIKEWARWAEQNGIDPRGPSSAPMLIREALLNTFKAEAGLASIPPSNLPIPPIIRMPFYTLPTAWLQP